jgi:YegS/Rv2252/BmrU family lipid kinase
VPYEISVTQGPGHATELARLAVKEGWRRIVAIGGDGTMGETLNGIVGSDAALGVIPAGTGNDMAFTLGMAKDMGVAARQLLMARTQRIDVGRDPDGHFGIILGLGFSTDVMQYCNTHSSLFQGSAAILAAIITILNRLRPVSMRVTMDNGSFEGAYMAVFVMNTRRTGGGLRMAPTASLTDGMFDLVLVGAMSKPDFLMTLPKAYQGRHLGNPAVSLHRTRKVCIETSEPLRKMFDGNVLGQTPVNAEVVPLGLSVLVPDGWDLE